MRVDQHPAPAEPSKRLGKTRASFRRARRLNALHLWAAVIGSLPALFLCLSGMLLVFEPELQGLEEREHIVVSPGEDLLPLRQLVPISRPKLEVLSSTLDSLRLLTGWHCWAWRTA